MRKTLFLMIMSVLATLFLVACGQKDVSFDTLETARNQAKQNAEYNAQVFRGASPAYANYAIEMQGDSSQLPNCPQGDGWASGKLRNKSDPNNVIPLKCSTVSGAVGCMTQGDFQTKPYAADDGRCQDANKVPFPIPKIAK